MASEKERRHVGCLTKRLSLNNQTGCQEERKEVGKRKDEELWYAATGGKCQKGVSIKAYACRMRYDNRTLMRVDYNEGVESQTRR